MDKTTIEIPKLTSDDFRQLLPPNLVYPGLSELFGHYSRIYLKQIISKMNSYTWFRFVEAESKSLIFKKMATRVLYKMLDREPVNFICAGNENGLIKGQHAIGLSSMGVNYKTINEDGIGIFERDNSLSMVVCDGVGDCLVGEVASYVILDQFRKNPNLSADEIFVSSVDLLTKLGRDLVKEIPEFETFPNEVSQAAVTSVVIKDNHCEICQVGDVLFYHIRDGELRLLDQNRRWLDINHLRKMFADEQYLAQRHIISNAVGRNYDDNWTPTYLNLQKDDVIILASDGLETLHPEAVQDVVANEANIENALNRLYRLCLDVNLRWNTVGAPIYTKPDNISIVLYKHP